MNSKLTWKVAGIAVLIAWALFKLYPNLQWYRLPLTERHQQAKRKNPLAQKVIPLGLDLQGGVHLVYQLDTSKLPDESDHTVLQAIEQNILVINNRIDGLGVANPFVARQGRDFVVIQLPGVYESEEAKKIIGQTALLEFRLVKDSDATLKIIEKINEKGLLPEDIVAGRIPAEVKELIPSGTEILPSRDGGYLLVGDKADLTGKYLKQARVELGGNDSGFQSGGLSIGFELDSQGAQLFEALTAAHINERLAIVLDRQVQSAPNIQSRIPGGRGQITGTFSPQEAKNLANVLNSGNLQAPMIVVEERTVGPELGEDSIRSGFKAMIIGFILVIFYIAIYYKISGLLADVALVLNLVLLMAVMAIDSIRATLTMPGIAGIILSLAMSIDANVIILERVREEVRKGKDPKYAIDEGYAKAFSAILDGNITTIVAALFLFQFGTGPIKGFAITLIIGLTVSMFTAVFVTKVFYEFWFSVSKPKVLSV